MIDLDSQGSMTSIFGGQVRDEWQTVFPLLARDYAESLQAENRARMARGEPPLPLEDTLAEALKIRAGDVAAKTHWPNIDLIGAQLNLYWAEFQVPVWRAARPAASLATALVPVPNLRRWYRWKTAAGWSQGRPPSLPRCQRPNCVKCHFTVSAAQVRGAIDGKPIMAFLPLSLPSSLPSFLN